MAFTRGQLVRPVLLLCLVSFAYGRSISFSSKTRRLGKRSSFSSFMDSDSCPPVDLFFFATGECENTCVVNEECPGNHLCCNYNHGCKTCMEPVPPPPVIDWLGVPDNRAWHDLSEGVNQIPVLKPDEIVEEVSCYYKGRTLSKDEVVFKGCHRCQCKKEGISCEVGPCRTDENENQFVEVVGGSGDDEEPSGEAENRVRTRVFARVESKPSEHRLIRVIEAPPGEGVEEPTDQKVEFRTNQQAPHTAEPTTTPLTLTKREGREGEWRFESKEERVKPTIKQRIFNTLPVRHENRIEEGIKVIHVHDVDTPTPPGHVNRESWRLQRTH